MRFRPPPETALFEALYVQTPELDRIAVAVEAAESSSGTDPLMWRPDPDGPQGPMQVSQAAAADVGGGNRWDPNENRALGRAYLAKMYRRFGNWTDAVMAYNWGPSSLDLWIRDGRPAYKLAPAVAAYRDRVLRDTVGETVATITLREPPPDPLRQAELQEEKIRDSKLRTAFHSNSGMVRQLQSFIDASARQQPGSAAAERAAAWLDAAGIEVSPLARPDPSAVRLLERAGAQQVFATLRRVSGRPGYELFATLAKAKSTSDLKLDVCRQIASVLLAKLREENAALLALDAGRREMPRDDRSSPRRKQDRLN
jgi:hypothetical protein